MTIADLFTIPEVACAHEIDPGKEYILYVDPLSIDLAQFEDGCIPHNIRIVPVIRQPGTSVADTVALFSLAEPSPDESAASPPA